MSCNVILRKCGQRLKDCNGLDDIPLGRTTGLSEAPWSVLWSVTPTSLACPSISGLSSSSTTSHDPLSFIFFEGDFLVFILARLNLSAIYTHEGPGNIRCPEFMLLFHLFDHIPKD
jgi:hypothetical protein